MKTTFDLPDDLVRQLKLRAVHDGRKLKDVAADLLREGLGGSSTREGAPARPVVTRGRKTGLPVIRCRRAAPRGRDLTPSRVAEILIDQEVEWHS